MPLKPCSCTDHSNNVAIITGDFIGGVPEPWELEFVRENMGKFVCYACGGEVKRADVPDDYDRVTASAVTSRLRELGLI
jgi:hypothetical protein